jgi:hypothetical protein
LKGTGGGMVVLFRKTLSKTVSIVKCVVDTLIWLKIEQIDQPNVYICFAYIPHDHNVYYTKYDSDLFDCILKDMSIFTQNGTVIVAGDLNSRVGNLPDYIEDDSLATPVYDILSNVIDYSSDVAMPCRVSEDTKVNSFGRKLLQLCKSTGLRIGNGRKPGDEKGQFTFYNHLGASVIDYVLAEKDYFDIVTKICIGDFNVWSDHAPVEFTLKRLDIACVSLNHDDVITSVPNTTQEFRWNDEHMEQMKRDLSEKVGDLYDAIHSIQSDTLTLDQGIEKFNEILNVVFQPCSRSVKGFKNVLPRGKSRISKNKPWFDDKCQQLYNVYRNFLNIFNTERSPENRINLVEAKGNYKHYERQSRRKYLRSEGNRVSLLRKINPKQFHTAFSKKYRSPPSNLCLSDFFEHFKSVCSNDTGNKDTNFDHSHSCVFEELDVPISDDEVSNVLKKLKSGKSPGIDNLLYEYFCKFCDVFTPLLSRLFNVIFDLGTFPTCWSEGIIFPSFKKGDANDPNNYRGITLVSCLSKIFTSVLNNRLLRWCEENDIVSDAQFGFRHGSGTADAIFALQGVISRTLSHKKKLYCCFVDYEKAFDKVNRNKLFLKLTRYGVTGKLLTIIKSLYSNLKSCVRFQTELSNFFHCTNGLMQGEGLSPLLFSLYVNDFENAFINDLCDDIHFQDVALFLLMYADDTVLFSESAEGLQNMLNTLSVYCNEWDLKVNINKTKVLVFRRGGKMSPNSKWYYHDSEIEVVDSFNYLGLTLNFNGKFTKSQSIIAEQGRKCMYHVLQICNNLSLNIESKLYVFDTYVSSVLNYGSEIWGFNPGHDIEKVHVDFCKRILYVKKCTPNQMVYGELGRVPMYNLRMLKIVKFWLKVIKTRNCVLQSIYDDMLFCDHKSCNWRCQVQYLLLSRGFGDVWYNHYVYNESLFLECFKQRLTDNFIQSRNEFFDKSSKCILYKYLTNNVSIQFYLTKCIPGKNVNLLTKFRLSAHPLRVEQGRYNGIARQERLCEFCNLNEIEDEYHFILICPLYKNLRSMYIKKYYWSHASMYKLIQLLTMKNRKQLCNLGKFLNSALLLRSCQVDNCNS